MTKKYTMSDKVTWKWGKSEASGEVEKVSQQKTEIQSKGQKVTRNGTADDPAIVIKQSDSTKVIKLASELE